MSERFAEFLSKSFTALARERPAIYHRFCCQLAPRTVSIAVDTEQVYARFARDGVRVDSAAVPAAVDIQTDRDAILSLIDAETTLADAVLDDRLVLRGRVEDLLAFEDALLTYVHGAVRAASFPELLRAYRTDVG